MTTILEHYEVLRELGVGGHASVLLGHDQRDGRQVVIKRMHDHLCKIDPSFAHRFRREAEVLQRIRHPNIVSILSFGGDPDHGLALVMEYLPGGTLEERMRTGDRLNHAAIVDIGVQLCAALQHGWSQGVLHRDIKPANVLFDADANPVLCDFGIARVDDSTTLTGTGETLGTPAYMSPEQVQGNSMDYRTDLYSIGLILFELLEGYLPFRKADAIATSLARIVEPAPQPGVENSAFRSFFKGALATDPAERFDSFDTAAAALAQCMGAEGADPTLSMPTMQPREGSARFEVDLELPIHSSQRLGSGVNRNIEAITSMSKSIPPAIESAAVMFAGYEKEWGETVELRRSFVTKIKIAVDRQYYKNLIVMIRVDESQVLLPRTRFVTYDERSRAIIHLQVDAELSSFSLVAYSPQFGRERTDRVPAFVVGIRRSVD